MTNLRPHLNGKSISTRLFVLPILFLCLIYMFKQPSSAVYSGYDISSYNTEISIGNDNVYNVNESISVVFNEPSHGIYRFIPLRQEMLWDGNGVTKRVVYNTKVNSVNVQNEPFTTYKENGNLVIKIGDPNEYINENKVYNFSYNHRLGDDKIEDRDFVYYNLIGTHWDASISNVAFKITLPTAFDSSKIHFYSGSFSSTAEAPVKYTVDRNIITGTLKTGLKAGEGLTVEVELPEGYFDVPASLPWPTFFIICSVLLALITLALFLRYGRDPVLIKSVEFYPPDEITSAEAGYIIDTSVDDNDVVSLIIYWASKGYLSIEQISKNDFTLIKQKALPEDKSEYEKHMFGQLFFDRNKVTVSELKENFYTTIDTTKGLIADHYSTKEERLYDPKSLALRRLTFFLSALLFFITLFYSQYIEYYTVLTPFIISLGMTVVLMIPFSSLYQILEKWNGLKNVRRVSKLILYILFGALALLLYVIYMYSQSLLSLGMTVALSAAFINAMSILMRKRTKIGNELLAKILGFKNFLELAEKPRLTKLVEENPSYFYDVIPFAYVLGVSDKWAKKFEGMAMRPPEWYRNSYDQTFLFTPLVFQLTLFQSLAFMQMSLLSRPAPPPTPPSGFGGGGFGGGGFSGGGFGGGGGGRW